NFPEEVKEIDTFISKFKTAKMNQKQAQEALDQAKKEADEILLKVRQENKEVFDTAKNQAKVDVKEAKKESKKIETEVKKGALNKFIEVGPHGPIPKANGYDVFKNMLRKDNNENRIKEIADRIRAAKDPEAQAGLESAYFTFMKDFYKATANSKR